MKVLGYNGGIDGYPAKFGSSHDSAAALVIDGEVVAACEEERFTREKHSGAFPRNAIEYCLREGGLSGLGDLDLITYYFSYPELIRPEVLTQNTATMGGVHKSFVWAYLRGMGVFHKLAGYNDDRTYSLFEREMQYRPRKGQFKLVPHHVCHAASTFYDSPFDRALVLTIDAQGESHSSLAIVAEGTNFKTVEEIFAPNSLGYFYLFMTTFLGFEKFDEYKVMGLAPYGNPAPYRDFFKTMIHKGPKGRYEVDQGMLTYMIGSHAVLQGERFIEKKYPRKMVDALGTPRRMSEPVLQRHMDIAAALQEALEGAVMHHLEYLQKSTGEKNLCLAGGVALNCTMNGKIARSGMFDEIWIHPAAHDSGNAVGAALYGYHNVLEQPRHFRKRKDWFVGPGYGPDATESALIEFDRKITHTRPADVYTHVAQEIANGKVVGWYNGRMEWGPRALGNRSILADPRRDDMKDIVNHAVKLREGFRPFAPACLAEHVTDWFDMKGLKESPYMLFIVPVKEDKRTKLPAVTHVDGSARVQTVTPADNERFHKLLTAFYKLTGTPVILNTSFNVKGEPIVNTPADAIRCFLNTQIDLLVIGDVVIEKRPEVADALRNERASKQKETGRVLDGQISVI